MSREIKGSAWKVWTFFYCHLITIQVTAIFNPPMFIDTTNVDIHHKMKKHSQTRNKCQRQTAHTFVMHRLETKKRKNNWRKFIHETLLPKATFFKEKKNGSRKIWLEMKKAKYIILFVSKTNKYGQYHLTNKNNLDGEKKLKILKRNWENRRNLGRLHPLGCHLQWVYNRSGLPFSEQRNPPSKKGQSLDSYRG